MSLKNRVLAVLRGREAARIRFTVPSASVPVTINHATFTTVANAIVKGKIGVARFVPTEHVAAQYDPENTDAHSTGWIEVPPILGRWQESVVMHECVHAFFDLTRSEPMAVEEEAVCCVVNALYFRMTGLASDRWWGEPFISAMIVANKLLREYAAGSRIPAVHDGAFRELMFAVAIHPTFWDGPAGIFGWAFGHGIRYVHDG